MVSPRGKAIRRGAHSRTALGGYSGEKGGCGSWGCRSNSGAVARVTGGAVAGAAGAGSATAGGGEELRNLGHKS